MKGRRVKGRREKKRRVRTAVLCVLWILASCVPTVRAEGSVYFIAAEDTVLPIDRDAMPFWSDGFLYISSDIFTGSGAARDALGISCVQNSARGIVALYSGGGSLIFDLETRCGQDDDGVLYYPGAILRDGVWYVPASAVADRFGLRYSAIEVEHGRLIWLRRPTFRLQEGSFARAVSHQLDELYEAFTRATEPDDPVPEAPPAAPSVPETPSQVPRTPSASPSVPEPETPRQTARPAPQTGRTGPSAQTRPATDAPSADAPADPPADPIAPVPEGPRIAGDQDLYLCLRAGDGTAALLDVLDRHGVLAAFYCDRAFLEGEGDLLRRMAASGHSIGLFPGEDDPQDLDALLGRAVCRKTRLLSPGEDAGGGWSRLAPSLDRSGAPLRSAAQGEDLLLEASREEGAVSLWLGGAVLPEALDAFLTAASSVGDRLRPLTETSFLSAP